MIVVGMHRHKSTTETAHYQEEDGDWRKRNCKTAGVWNEAGVSNCRGKWLSVSRVAERRRDNNNDDGGGDGLLRISGGNTQEL